MIFEHLIGNNRIEDVRWLCSLTDSELDFLIGLRCLAQQRAKRIGHVALAEKVDLKMLRELSFTLMENLKCQLKELRTDTSSFSGGCNLLKCDPDEKFASMGIQELQTYVCNDKRKRIVDMFNLNMSPNKKMKCDGG